MTQNCKDFSFSAPKDDFKAVSALPSRIPAWPFPGCLVPQQRIYLFLGRIRNTWAPPSTAHCGVDGDGASWLDLARPTCAQVSLWLPSQREIPGVGMLTAPCDSPYIAPGDSSSNARDPSHLQSHKGPPRGALPCAGASARDGRGCVPVSEPGAPGTAEGCACPAALFPCSSGVSGAGGHPGALTVRRRREELPCPIHLLCRALRHRGSALRVLR